MSAKLKKRALEILDDNPLTLKELADKLEIGEKRTFRILRSLFQKGEIKSFMGKENKKLYQKNKSQTN